ncbi:MAG TPA: glycosyltransferase family 4 protein [Chthoniobacteraceae bacterium]
MLTEHGLRHTDRVRIALVHYSYAPTIGGVETVLHAHATLFADAGHEVTIICARGGSGDPRVAVESYPPSPRTADALRSMLHEAFGRHHLVIVHNVLTTPFDLELTAAIIETAIALPQVRFLCWVHDLIGVPERELLLARQAFSYITVSEHRREQTERLTGFTSRVVPNGLDPTEFLGLSATVSDFVRTEGVLEREIVLLHPARIVARKNIEFALHVVAALKSAGRDVCYLLTGADDPHTAGGKAHAHSLRALQRQLGLEHEAHFLGDRFAVTKQDVISLFTTADALFFPSREEGFGLPVLEAALHRLPIFCPDLAPMNSLPAHLQHTFTVGADPESVATLITKCLAASHATQARKAVVRDYAWKAIYRNHLEPLLAEPHYA